MSEKKKRNYGEPIFHCFVAKSLVHTLEHIRTIQKSSKVNYIHIDDTDDFHYFMLQYLQDGVVQG